ncbi:MAG: helix-turn-helix transcriptional regulator [Flavobacteriales bacterium]|nr:helix-turn-helix transcriptional regulator [Flavobacteriales bacterium]
MSRETLADFVASKRKALKLTQPQLADKAGVGLRFLRELEAGKATLRMDKVNDVLHLFGHALGPVPMERNTPESRKRDETDANG